MLRDIIKLANRFDQLGLYKEAELLDNLANKVAKEDKWIQEADPEEDKFEKWCKRHGYDEGVGQSCINEAARSDSTEAKRMANFAVNVSDGKYTYPDTDDS